MHQGVIRDVEQPRVKKERMLEFEMHRELEEQYKKLQNVRDGGAIDDDPRWQTAGLFSISNQISSVFIMVY